MTESRKYSTSKSVNEMSGWIVCSYQLLTSHMKTAASNPAIPCVGVFMNAPDVDVVVLLPVDVEDEAGLVNVAVVDPE